MTPQEQIEEPYGHEKVIGVCRVSGDWIEVESTDQSCPHRGCDCGLAFFRAIRFDSPQISEGEVTEAAREYLMWLERHEAQPGLGSARALENSRERLSAALTQKGDNE